ncbi:sigma factor-like helix-turn-helix DNA-binding protein [Pseudonocardia sp.]|uniref:RNA polymerase sigma factor n=1 Tax=Pseudonocardia sp. TaxID=60912 RepID=UPI003D14939E
MSRHGWDRYRARWASDAALAAALRAENAAGVVWADVRERLAELGVATLHKLIVGGRLGGDLHRVRAAQGVAVALLARMRVDPDLRTRVVNDCVLRGLERFRATVLDRTWSSEGGASLSTWFVNGCLIGMRSVLRLAATRAEEPDGGAVGLDSLDMPADVLAAADDEAEDDESVRRLLDSMPPRLRAAVELKLAEDLTWKECADRLEISPRVIEAQLYRWKKWWRRNHGKGER